MPTGNKEDDHSTGESNQEARTWHDWAHGLTWTYLGLCMPTGQYLLVLVDYFSQWVEVDVMKSSTCEITIKCLNKQNG